jgi:hypothetical protein
MTKYMFFSDVNQTVFVDYLEARDIVYEEVAWNVILVAYANDDVRHEALSLGAEECQ